MVLSEGEKENVFTTLLMLLDIEFSRCFAFFILALKLKRENEKVRAGQVSIAQGLLLFSQPLSLSTYDEAAEKSRFPNGNIWRAFGESSSRAFLSPRKQLSITFTSVSGKAFAFQGFEESFRYVRR